MSSGSPAAGADRPNPNNGWQRRPILSAALRSSVYAAPVAAGLVVSLLLSRGMSRPPGALLTICWWVAVADATLLTVIAVERITRQLLPLAALLNLSLAFPDQAPRRFAVARRVGRPRDLQHQLEEARAAHGKTADIAYMQTILELIAALSVFDQRTRGHVDRVRVFTEIIAAEMHLPDADRARLRWAAMLHDIGKLTVPAEVLNKKGSLNPAEWEVVRRHPEEGARLIDPLRPWLGPWALAVEHHHEHWDGSGYPRGLVGEQISLGGRIVAVADAFETMTTARPYKRPMSVAAARAELVRCAGTQFDPAVVRALLNVSMGRCWRAVGIASLVAQFPLISPIRSALFQLSTVAPSAVATGLAALPLVLTMPTPAQLGAHGNPLASPPSVVAAATLPADSPSASAASSPSPQSQPADPTATPAPASAPRSVPPSARPSPTPAPAPPSARPSPKPALGPPSAWPAPHRPSPVPWRRPVWP